jgi:cysteine synthase
MTLSLHRRDGLLVGPSTGAIVHAISEYSDLAEGVVVGVSPDGSAKYTTYFTDMLGTQGHPT